MENLESLSLNRKFSKLSNALEDEMNQILEIESSKRSIKQKRKLSYIQQAIRNCKKKKSDHNLIRKILNL